MATPRIWVSIKIMASARVTIRVRVKIRDWARISFRIMAMLRTLLCVRFRFKISIWVPDWTLESIEMVRFRVRVRLSFRARSSGRVRLGLELGL